MISLTPRRAGPLALLAALLAQTACTDLPTGAESFQLEADGELWTAVLPPVGLPTASTWLAYSEPSTPETHAATAAVQSLQADALHARAVGDLPRAQELLGAAARHAVAAMDASPGPGVFLTGIASLDAWQRTVRSGVDLSRAPALATALEEVGRDREAVEEALRAGDQPAAALHLTRAAERARDWAPQAVALRVLGRVDAQLAAAARSPEEEARAAHLVQSARLELLNGEPLRAVQRALYALQLAGGNELREIPVEGSPACGEYSC